MKFDLHCHTKEGSLDAKLGIVPYAKMLKEQGYDGMLVTDHNSYKGYEAWVHCQDKPEELKDFVVLKGIEYDTRDGGHVLIILPDRVDCPLLEKRGMKFCHLEKLVHTLGGIIGAAHPYGYGYFAITNTNLYKNQPDIIKKFDFIESYNSGIPLENNKLAKTLAQKYKKPETAGSDAHSAVRVGTAYSVFEQPVTCNNDLIRLILKKEKIRAVGKVYDKLLKHRMFALKMVIIWGYWIYNKTGMVLYTYARHKEMKHMRQTLANS